MQGRCLFGKGVRVANSNEFKSVNFCAAMPMIAGNALAEKAMPFDSVSPGKGSIACVFGLHLRVPARRDQPISQRAGLL